MGNRVLSTNHGSTTHDRTKPGIWLALLIALGLHASILFIPLSWQKTDSNPALTRIELQIIKSEPSIVAREIFQTAPEPLPAPGPSGPTMVQELSVPSIKSSPEVATPTQPAATLIPIERNPELMSTAEKRRLTNTILSSQFINEESAADQLFGKPIAPNDIEYQAEFHYPKRDNLTTILSQPMQELPFDYKPGLIYFAYEPGVKGDLQHFWDTITPEFGWITRYGTEVRCKWILIMAACGWK